MSSKYRVTKGFKFHARPQTGAYSCCHSLSGFSASNSPFLFLSLSSFIDLFVVGAVFCLVLVSLVLEICGMAGPIAGDGELLAACVLVICFSPVLVDFCLFLCGLVCLVLGVCVLVCWALLGYCIWCL